MTISRTIATTILCCLVFPMVFGQEQPPSPDTPERMPAWFQQTHGLMGSDTIDSDLQVPNVFSPNGDQVNDLFRVTTDGTTVYELTVFTRTGTPIYHSVSPQIQWDGKSMDGKELKEGVYYYVIEKQEGGNPIEKAGFMHLFR